MGPPEKSSVQHAVEREDVNSQGDMNAINGEDHVRVEAIGTIRLYNLCISG